MAKKNTETALATKAAPAPALPAHLQGNKATSTKVAVENRSRSRMKIIAELSDKDMKDEHGIGALVLSPDGVLLASAGEEFEFIPICEWVSYEKRADRKDKESPFILESTMDRTSQTAVRSMNPRLREERYGPGDKFTATYVQSLNFILSVNGQVGVFSFNRGSFKYGQQLNSAIARVSQGSAEMYDMVLKTSTRQVQSAGGDYYWVLSPFEFSRWVDESERDTLKQMHEEASRLVTLQQLVINDDGSSND